MKALVTGCSGRLGPFVIAELEQAGHEVTLFSRQPPGASFSHLPWVQGDICNP
jgi:nucleoside-diphosphate-sugar epimerase